MKHLKNLPVAVYNPSNKDLMNKDSNGMEFLKNFIVTIDWLKK